MTKKIYALLCVVVVCVFPTMLFAQPVANFSANVTSGCSPIVVDFTDLSTGSPTGWQWDLGNGTTSTLQNPSTTYINPGTYTVTLTATNAGGSNTQTLTGYITVNASPFVNFIASDSSATCPPKTVQFTNTSVPGASGTTSYYWDFGDGNISTATNPTHTYTSSGNFNVTLVVTNGTNCTRSLVKTQYIHINAKPTANFTAINNNACAPPLSVNFTNTTTGATSYNWFFGDGGTSNAVSPSHTYTATGSYTVMLVATNAGGCKDTFIRPAFVNIGNAIASFTMSSPPSCTGNTVTFTNTSQPGPGNSTWYFGDGGTATTANATHTYANSGTYTVKLRVQNGTCIDSTTQTITILTGPNTQFTASPTSSCTTPLTVNFNNTTTGATSYLWLFGDGSTSTATNPSHTYTSYGGFYVKLVSTSANGCKDTMTLSTPINIVASTGNISFSPAALCAPAVVTFSLNILSGSAVTATSWNFGDGNTATGGSATTISHVYAAVGTYTVTCTYTTLPGCTNTLTTTLNVGVKPTAAFTGTPTTVCPNAPVQFTNNSTGASTYTWLFGDGTTSTVANPSHAYAEPGTYTVTLIASNGTCTDTLVMTNMITVVLPLSYYITISNCSNRLNLIFQDASQGANTYLWDFGDGQTSTQAGGTISHTYASYGSYTITLTVTNTTTGCTDVFSNPVVLFPIDANFHALDTTICKGQSTTFVADSNQYYTNYSWNFGDGSADVSSSSRTASHVYTAAGLYTVRLVVKDYLQCTDTFIKTAYIHVGGPTVDFSGVPTTGCQPMTVFFQDLSTPNGGFPIVGHAWSFEGGGLATANVPAPSKTYFNLGEWDVKLIVTDANGCIDSLRKNDYIKVARPVAQFFTNDTVICTGQTVQFTNNSGGNNFTSAWTFGDGGTSNALTPAYTYNTPGIYTVRLIVTDATGCKDTAIRTAYIKVGNPAVDFAMSDTFANCPPLAVNFTNLSTGTANYTWTFGNGSQSVLTNPNTVYTYPGVYSIKLVATGSGIGGCKDSITKTVTVLGPTGTFTYSTVSGCLPLTVQFNSVSQNATSLIWDMDNGVTQTTVSSPFTYTYTQSGSYLPKLILSDGASCLVPVIGLDTIKIDKLEADFSFAPAPACVGSSVQFTDTVLSTLAPVATRNWTFGDGGTSAAHNPTHAYANSGTYTITLVVGNTGGCLDTIIKTISINPLPIITAGNDVAICPGQSTSAQLQAGGGVSYIWTPATGLSCTNCANPTAAPAATTIYTVTGTNANGCVNADQVTVSISPLPSVSAGSNVAICAGSATNLQATGAATYVWTPATGLSCTNCANPTATPLGTTTYVVTGTDAGGCTDTGMVTVTINPQPTVTVDPVQPICIGGSRALQSNGATTYTWTPATGLSCTNCANPTASPTTTTTYTVTGTANGCTNTAQITITVNPLPTITAGSDVTICQGQGNPAQLQANGGVSYSWSPATGLSCTACANPTASPTATTIYTLTGTNANGCSSTDQLTVNVAQPPSVGAGSNVAICAGAATTLQATGATSYVWTPATGLSCTNCANPTATPAATTTYTVTGTNANGCTDTGMVTVTVNPLPTVTVNPVQPICVGGSATLQANGATGYTWTPATGLSCTNCASPTATPATTTTYTVTGTANGCSSTAQVTLTVNPLPTVSAGANQTVCVGASAQLQATGATSYTWSPATGLSCTSCANPVATPTTTTTYTVTGTNANGCVNTSQVTVTVNPIPAITVSSNVTICDGASTSLLASGGQTYSWSPAIGLSCTNCANPTASPTTTTTYTVTGNNNGCTSTAQVTVTVSPKPTVDAGADVAFCVGESTTLQASGAGTYVWSPAAGLSCTSCASPVATPTATTTYTVTGTAANGCTNTDQVTVTVHQLPAVDAGANQTICIGDVAQLQASGAASFVWSPATALSCTNCAAPVSTTQTNITYTVTGTDANGCVNSDNVAISVIPRQPVTFGGGDTLCVGQSTMLNASGGDSYTWIPGTGLSNTNIPNPIAAPETTTQYMVIIQQGNCFADTGYVTVVVYPNPTVNLGPDRSVFAGESALLFAEGANIATYTWTPDVDLSCNDCATPTAMPKKTTTYTVDVVSPQGCEGRDDITIRVSCDNSQVFIPNTFTPNADGNNDRFYISGKGIETIKRLRVLNRWGEVIFDVQNIPIGQEQYGWDGTHKNMPVKPDVFVYIVDAICDSGEPMQFKGDISVIR